MYRGNTKDKRFNWAAMIGNARPNTLATTDFLLGARFEFQNEGGFKYLATAIEHPRSSSTPSVSRTEEPEERARGRRRHRETEPIEKSGSDYPCVIGTSKSCTWTAARATTCCSSGAAREDLPGQRHLPARNGRGRGGGRGRRPADIELDAYAIEAGFFVTPGGRSRDATTS